MTLQITWFLIVGFMLLVFTLLDGFDLGIGIWYLLGKEKDRRVMLSAIGPMWDANEVWLIAGGASLFAAFPAVYATVFSGFYLPLILVLLALIMRGIAVEVRNMFNANHLKRIWDISFALGSILVALLLGVAVGNLFFGMELDAAGNYIGGFFALLNPYSLLVGLTGFSMFAVHGAAYLKMKSTDETREKASKWLKFSTVVFGALFVILIAVTALTQPQIMTNVIASPVLWLLPVITLISVALTLHNSDKGEDGQSFVFSCVTIVTMFLQIVIALAPNLVRATNSEFSLTVFNSSSTQPTLMIMLIIAGIGLPIVVGYQIWIYRTFSGKVKPENTTY